MRHIDPMEWGRLIGRFEAEREATRAERDVNRRLVEDHEERITDLEKLATTYTTWATRGGLLLCLWGGALILNLNAEQKAEVASAILKQLAR